MAVGAGCVGGRWPRDGSEGREVELEPCECLVMWDGRLGYSQSRCAELCSICVGKAWTARR